LATKQHKDILTFRSASLYIHIPFCAKRCAYCDFFSTVQDSPLLFTTYIDKVLKDISFFKDLYLISHFDTVYIGGGTPSLLSPKDVFHLSNKISLSQKRKIKEFTVEANPEDITKEWLKSISDGGVTRLSIGIQSLSNEVLKNENRRGSRFQTLKALEEVSIYWKSLLSLDFIAGLKDQNIESLIEDLEVSIKVNPHHISLYELVSHSIESQKEIQKKEAIFNAGVSYIKKKGYIQYEVSNFSYEGKFECEHNKVYWHLGDYIGIGSGAVGNIKLVEDVVKGVRFTGKEDLNAYIKEENRLKAYSFEDIENKDLLKDAIMMGFRLVSGINRDYFKKQFGVELTHLIPKTLEKWKEKELLIFDGECIKLNKNGLLLLNTFLFNAFKEIDEN